MSIKLTANINNPPVSGLATAHLISETVPVEIVWGNETSLLFSDGRRLPCHSNNDVLRALARAAPEYKLYGETAIERTQIDHWLSFSLTCGEDISWALAFLDKSIAPVTYLVANKLTIADFALYNEMHSRYKVLADKGIPQNVQRWYDLISAQRLIQKVIQSLPDEAKISANQTHRSENSKKTSSAISSKPSERKQEGKFVDLPGAEMGKVIVRFPPEASGYLHIGHAKAALLNQYYAQAFNGKLIMRFDDTNPAKETVEFEKVILGDLELLNITPDIFTHTSNYFDLMLTYCEQLINEGKAYVDDTPPEQMKAEREQNIESKNRSNDVSQNMSMWKEMLNGSEYGQKCCVRAKIDMSSLNGCMRDPTIYRCKNEPHPRTGTKYRVYPTYDFACPIVDAIENVTHTLRTMEYHDRDDQFYWFIDALKLRKPYIWEYSRLNMTNTVLSKRKLTWFVESGLVDGWDDPRFPTVRGIIRRGMTVEGLREFIIAQGSSKSVVFMNWDKIWAFNKKVIDPIAPRYTALEYDNRVVVNVQGAKKENVEVPVHPKNESLGKKSVLLGPKIFIDYVDAEALKEGENATFINWGNLLIKEISKDSNGKIISIDASLNLDNKDFKKTVKLTWLAVEDQDDSYPPTYCVFFDNIISKAVLGKDEDFKQFIGHKTREEHKMLGDPELKKCKKGDIIQLQRRGFFKVDNAYRPSSAFSNASSPVILFSIPDGHTKDMPSSGLKINTATNQDANKTATSNGVCPAINCNQKKTQADKAQFNADGKSEKAYSTVELLDKIAEIGGKIRKLKSEKAAKAVIDSEVKNLLSLKAEYKELTGSDWTPVSNVVKKEEVKISSSYSTVELLDKIGEIGGKIRQLKSAKADKAVIDSEVKNLLSLKAKYKELTGSDWTPGSNVVKKEEVKMSSLSVTEIKLITKEINAQVEKIRELKAYDGAKEEVEMQVHKLLALKAKYKEITGENFSSPERTSDSKKPVHERKSEDRQSKNVKHAKKLNGAPTTVKKRTRLGLEETKEGNLSDWYSQVITKAELIEYYDVSGCYILRPWSFTIWKSIKNWLDGEITKLGVQECYFPIFVSKTALEKEKDHIADFAPEVAWVTKAGESDLAEPIAVRPTSETVMYPAYAKWIQSYRDLPIRLNQWNNVVRWEFKHPQPFLRTREFLWQEGHTTFANKSEAEKEVLDILELYAQVYTQLLAVPVIRGRKTEKEKFAGAEYTTTVEIFISASGRAIQGATSHHLGQKFSKMFDIVYEDPETQEKRYVYQNSWGLTTRTIGVMIMVHADNQGLVLPPNVASIQVIIIPCGITVNNKDYVKECLIDACRVLERQLCDKGIRCKGDYRDYYSPGWKFNHWELKGVPLRIELGPKDIEAKHVVAVCRDIGEKVVLVNENLDTQILELLENIHHRMLSKAEHDLSTHKMITSDWGNFCHYLDEKYILLSPFCGEISCEDKIKADSARDGDAEPGAPAMGAKSLCIPFEQPRSIAENEICVHPDCKKKAKFFTYFGRSY